MLQILAQGLETFPWDKAIGLSGGAAWALVAYLFLSDRIRPTASAQREIDAWQRLYEAEKSRADKCDQRLVESLQIARQSVNMTESVIKKSGT